MRFNGLWLLAAAAGTAAIPQDLLVYKSASTSTTSTSTSQMSTITPTPSCRGQTINAPEANLLYWDTVVHQFAFSAVNCRTVHLNPTSTVLEWTTLHGSSDYPYGTSHAHFTAASSIIAMTAVPIFTETDTRKETITHKGDAVETITHYSTYRYNPTSAYLVINDITEVLAAETPAVTITGAAPVAIVSTLEIEQLVESEGSCVTSTSTANLASPLVISFAHSQSSSWQGSEEAAGALPSDMITQLPSDLASMTAGSYRGLPTVVIASYSIFPIWCNDKRPFRHLIPEHSVGSGDSSGDSEPAPASTPTPVPGPAGVVVTRMTSDAAPAAAPTDDAAGETYHQNEKGSGATGSKGDEGGPPATMTAAPTGPVDALASVAYFGKEYTADENGEFTINGQTLGPGGTITVNGKTLELGNNPTALVMHKQHKTITFPIHLAPGHPPEPTGTSDHDGGKHKGPGGSWSNQTTASNSTTTHKKHKHKHLKTAIGRPIASGLGGLDRLPTPSAPATTSSSAAAAAAVVVGQWMPWSVLTGLAWLFI